AISTVPADPAGEVAVIDVAEATVTLVAGLDPNATVVAPATNPVPVIVTTVPPFSGPPPVLRAVTVGGGENVNWFPAPAAEAPRGVLTETATVPMPSAGEVAVIDVAEFTVKLAAGWPAPKVTVVAPATKPVPVIVTDVPPAIGPEAGLTADTVGTG